ncbi:low specificity L-threonine aldolase [Prevotella sp. HUN102]|uniref:threonine aldolase family protein n=1 Tax=Prevotella sp. HUN102 TaxID=1392486 RepID=UPI00048DE16B|nr:aminotransferase class V-fold PLP-dependent enzyme [Prevotella sp. HUN102]
MLSFESDYNNGAHPDVLRYLLETNDEQTPGYGFDRFSECARQKIREACGFPDADIFFLSGGTQTNATVIDGVLQSYEAVISAETGHINVHEATAVEASGHKVIALPSHDGKIAPEELEKFMENFTADENKDHCAQPGMVYITFPTELGTLYSRAELDYIYKVCRRFELPLFVDGARLGYGLMSEECGFDLKWLAAHCDVFYIGGTKVGALCGEAVVFANRKAPKHFFTIVKRHGALMAKGRLIGAQFDALFSDNLYFRISRHAIEMANRLKTIFRNKGYRFVLDSPTNQQFVVLDNTLMERLGNTVLFSRWEPYSDTETVCRFVTSWATRAEDLDALEKCL